MRAVIVGHGNSVFEIDHDIDSYDIVIRLKDAPTGGTLGVKTTAIVASQPRYHNPKFPLWLFGEKESRFEDIDKIKWLKHFAKFKSKVPKPSNGMIAMYGVKQFLDLDEITLAGFDVMRDQPEDRLSGHRGSEPFKWWHDFKAERKAAEDLFKRVIFL